PTNHPRQFFPVRGTRGGRDGSKSPESQSFTLARRVQRPSCPSEGDHSMPVNSIPPHAHHIPSPRALEASKGKAASTPAFRARAQAETVEGPFGRIVSEIAKAKKTAAVASPMNTETPANTDTTTPPADTGTTPPATIEEV